MWILLALYFALWNAISAVIIKKIVTKTAPFLFVFISEVFIFPFVIGMILIFGGFPGISDGFWLFIIGSSTFDLVAFLAVAWAYRIADISLVAPMSSFNPVFATIMAMIFLGETPTPTKFIGIAVIAIGTYLLDIKRGLFVPLKKLFSNRGVQLFLLANLLWGVTPVFQKQAIGLTHTASPLVGPLFTALISNGLVTIYLLPWVIAHRGQAKQAVVRYWWVFLILAPFTALAQLAGFTTYTLTNIGYATAIFKLSTLFTIIMGWLVFGEKDIKQRFIGALVMLAGTFILVL